LIIPGLHVLGTLAVVVEEKKVSNFDTVMLAVYTVGFSGALTVMLGAP